MTTEDNFSSYSLFQILVDDNPIGELDIKWLRERIGFVGQVRIAEFCNSSVFIFLSFFLSVLK